MTKALKFISLTIVTIILFYSPHKNNVTIPEKVLFLNNFESERDLDGLNFQCGKILILTKAHKTHGKMALLAKLPKTKYPGISFTPKANNWSEYDMFKVDIYSDYTKLIMGIRVDDSRSSGDYHSRFNKEITLNKGLNNVEIKISEIENAPKLRKLNIKQIKRVYIFLGKPSEKRELYFDAIRLVRQ